MATEIQIRAKLDTMLSLPLPLARLEKSLGIVSWPGQATRVNFPSGMELNLEDRAFLEERLAELRSFMTGDHLHPDVCSKARLSLLTSLLLGYPASGGSSDQAAEARLGFYQNAVSDVAPWAIDAAIKRWGRGDVLAQNTDFAPGPGTLRKLCEQELEPLRAQANKLNRLLSAISIERAMDAKPLESGPTLVVIR